MQPNGVLQALKLVRSLHGADAVAMLSNRHQAGVDERTAGPVLSAAIDSGDAGTAFAIFDVLSSYPHSTAGGDPDSELLEVMAEAAVKKNDRETLQRLVVKARSAGSGDAIEGGLA